MKTTDRVPVPTSCDPPSKTMPVLNKTQQERNETVLQWLPLVGWAIEKLRKQGKLLRLSHDDAIQEGYMALLKAVHYFDASRGFQFSTYAYNVIAREVLRREFEETIIRVPLHLSLKSGKKNPELVKKGKLARKAMGTIFDSACCPETEDEDIDFLEQEKLQKALQSLSRRDQQILYYRYRDNLKLDDIGAAFQLSGESIRQRLQIILENLREKMTA